MKQINKAGPEIIGPLTPPSGLSPRQVRHEMDQGALVLDLRSPAEFARGHIPGALNIGFSPNLSTWAGWLIDPNPLLVLVCPPGRALDGKRRLLRVGLDRVVGTLDGGVEAWRATGEPVESLEETPPSEVVRRMGAPVLP